MKYLIRKDGKKPLQSVNYERDLNPEQYNVITEAEGPCLVLAGAGSGKTRTLIYRVAYLLERGIPPVNILLVTFTNKAARNMQDRIEMLLKAKPRDFWSGTFHHIGNRSLRLYAKELGFRRDFGILDEEDAIGLIKVCMKSINLKEKDQYFPRPRVIRSIISYSVNSGEDLEDVIQAKYPYFVRYASIIKTIHAEYILKKKQSSNMDYDDLLFNWLWILKNVPAAKERFSRQFHYILVDEYQDTNRLQSQIIKELASFHDNVLVVGDDAQAIYSFRGADVSNILRFPEEYKDAKIYKLETNYRSSPEILTLANNSISHNKHQYPKTLKAVNESYIKPVLVEPKDLYSQAEFVAQRVLELRDEGIPLIDIAVLFRAHYQSAELEMELTKRNIPFIVRGGVRFFEQAHIKDVLAYVKILVNPYDEISWLRVLSMQPGIGTIYAGRIFDEFAKDGKLSKVIEKKFGRSLPERTKKGLLNFKKIMSAVIKLEKGKKPHEIILGIIENGYERYVMSNFDNAKDRADDLHELVNFAHNYKSIKKLLHDITLRESFKGETINGTGDEREQLILSTIHQAKGLEWKAVFVIGLSEGQFPHAKSMEEMLEMEEERRLFYVAATRTKKELLLSHPVTRFDYKMGMVISRRSLFLDEMDESCYQKWELEEEFSDDKIVDLDKE